MVTPPTATDVTLAWSVNLYACLSVTLVYPANAVDQTSLIAATLQQGSWPPPIALRDVEYNYSSLMNITLAQRSTDSGIPKNNINHHLKLKNVSDFRS